MAVTPINITRVSNSMQTMSLLESLRQNTLALFTQQKQVSSGLRFSAASEDPVSAAKVMNLSELLTRQDQILANIRKADSFLSASDSAIGNVNDLLLQAKSIASEMVNSTTSQSQRDSTAELVQGLIQEMVRIGNQQINGTYLFGGQKCTTEPFTREAQGVVFHGDQNSLAARLDDQGSTAFNVNGAQLFGALSSEVAGYADLNPSMSTDTRLADLFGAAGRGIDRGVVRISMSSPPTGFTADLSTGDTVGDVIDLLNAAAESAGLTVGPGMDFDAAANAAGNGVDITAGAGTVTVAEAGEGFAARDLGIVGTGAVINGLDLNPRLTLTTPVASFFGGAGAALGSIQIRNGTIEETVDLSGCGTVQEILNQINKCGASVIAEINSSGTAINILNRLSGTDMSIGEAGGNTAELLGFRSLRGEIPLSSLNQGRGVDLREGKDDFQIVAKDGSLVTVNIDGASTVQDVLDAINAAAAAAGVAVTAAMATTGNGIQITDATGGAGELCVESLNLSAAAQDLGLCKSADTAGGNVLTGDDVNGVRTDSVFTALMDLYAGLKQGDTTRITDAGGRIEGFIDHVATAQGTVGARSQAVSTRLELTEGAVIATQSMLSDVRDLDFTEAITKFQQAQTALQANLLSGSKVMQLSLLNYLS